MNIRELLEAYKKIDFDTMEDETGLNEEKKPEIKKAEYKEIKPKKPETEKVKGIAEEVNNEEEESIDEDIESFSNKLDNATRDLKDLIKDLQKTNESLEMNEVSDELVDKALGKAQREVIKGKMTDDKELENKGKKHLKGLKKQAEKREKRKCESLHEDVVAKFDGGKHEIVKCKEGYFNRYNIKEGKARFTTKCVESLPTALGALKKRFPKAEEDK